MRNDRLPLTYDECRAEFHRAAADARLEVVSHPIAARGPAGQELTIDVVHAGEPGAPRVLVVLSGVHGVEGFIGSALQCELLDRLGEGVPDGVAVVVVHTVNPWGMAWWRRQNESNVDLNRNWRRDAVDPPANDAYDELHPLACPDTAELPDADALVVTALEVVATRGMEWVRNGITRGQYTRPDGLHYGGAVTEESNRILEDSVVPLVDGVERLLVVDLHTGHGPRGEVTLLSDQPPGSRQHRFFAEAFAGVRVEATVDNPEATTGEKVGQIANGIRAMFPDADAYATSAELGTASDEEQLVATYRESWVHRHGDLADPEHAAARWDYRCCFTPDDPEWETAALEGGRRLLAAALEAMMTDPNG